MNGLLTLSAGCRRLTCTRNASRTTDAFASKMTCLTVAAAVREKNRMAAREAKRDKENKIINKRLAEMAKDQGSSSASSASATGAPTVSGDSVETA